MRLDVPGRADFPSVKTASLSGMLIMFSLLMIDGMSTWYGWYQGEKTLGN
jgi:hypothetical protein